MSEISDPEKPDSDSSSGSAGFPELAAFKAWAFDSTFIKGASSGSLSVQITQSEIMFEQPT